MKIRLRYTLTATFTLIAIVPVLFIGLWVERTSYLRELSSVEEKHLLLAKNITNAIELYTHDAAALFDFLVESRSLNSWPEGATELAESLDFGISRSSHPPDASYHRCTITG